MWLLLNWRIWLLVGLLSLGPIGYMKGRGDGKRLVHTEWAAAVSAANSEARHLEIARQSAADAASRDAAARTARILSAAASARAESSGLRDDLSAANEYAKKSRDAAERTARIASGLLGECSRLLIEDAEAAARADSYARELMQAWPSK